MDRFEELTPRDKIVTSETNLDKFGEEIMQIWERRVRSEVDSAGDLLRPALRNALPKFLHLLAAALSEKKSRGLIMEGSNIVKLHAGDRARETAFGPPEIVQELQMLRETVISQLEKEMHLSPKEYETIQRTFDQAIQEALMEYFLVHAQLREQFMATLSHDLRNPIGVGKMGAQIIQDMAQDIQDPKIKEDIMGITGRIISNMKRADRMIQDLLDASILRIGEKIPTQISKCDLFSIVHDVVNELIDREKLRIQITGSPVAGYWDCEGLRRSIENLIRNAIKYGGTDSPVSLKLARTGSRVQLSVHNMGNPISEQDQKVIFRTFGRTKAAKESGHQGWGIGLALVRAVCESLGGSVQVESSPEAGTTFTIDLPEDSRSFTNPQHH